MKAEDFIRNLRGIDSGADPDPEMLNGVYERIKTQQFKPGSDHVTQVYLLEIAKILFASMIVLFVAYEFKFF